MSSPYRPDRGRQGLHDLLRAVKPETGLAGAAVKSANIVFKRLPYPDLAAEKAAFGIRFNRGEVCSNSRLLVERAIYADFITRVQAKMKPGCSL